MLLSCNGNGEMESRLLQFDGVYAVAIVTDVISRVIITQRKSPGRHVTAPIRNKQCTSRPRPAAAATALAAAAEFVRSSVSATRPARVVELSGLSTKDAAGNVELQFPVDRGRFGDLRLAVSSCMCRRRRKQFQVSEAT